jgi:hypothetical protein
MMAGDECRRFIAGWKERPIVKPVFSAQLE